METLEGSALAARSLNTEYGSPITMHSDSYGWVDGERVPLTPAEGWVWPDEASEATERTRGSGLWWPSEADRALWLGLLSRPEAGEVSEAARRELVYWLAADGLQPMAWARRWTGLLWRLAPERLPAEARTLFGAAGHFERAVLEAFFPAARNARLARAERARIESVFRGLGGKLAPVRRGTPLSVEDLASGTMASEWCGWPACDAEVLEEAAEVARLTMRNQVAWLSEDGAWALGALKRYYVLVFVRYTDLAPRMTGNDYGEIYGQTRAAFCEDAKRYIGLPLEAELGYRPKVAGQKSAAAADAYARNAAEHCPRRQLGGEAFATEKSEQARKADAEARLAEARAMAERRQVEREAEEMRRIAERNRERRRRGQNHGG